MAVDFATLVYLPCFQAFARPVTITPLASQPGAPQRWPGRRAEAELAALYRERELARARTAERDPASPLQIPGPKKVDCSAFFIFSFPEVSEKAESAMKWVFSALALLVFMHAASAQQRLRATDDVSFYVAPDGNDDGNDCLAAVRPCRTAQYAYERAMRDWDFAGFSAYIRLSPGIHHGGVQLAGVPVGTYLVNIEGRRSDEDEKAGRCTLSQAEQIIVEGSSGTNIFAGEDLAIPAIGCLTLRAECIEWSGSECVARASGVTGIYCRQTPVVDLAFIKFDGLSIGITAGSCGEINLAGAMWISNSMHVFLQASGSQILRGSNGPIIALNPVDLTYFALSYDGARIYLAGPAIENLLIFRARRAV